VANFTITAGATTDVSGNYYYGYNATGEFAHTGSISSGPVLDEFTVTGCYTIANGLNPTIQDFRLALAGNANVSGTSFCVSFTDYYGNSFEFLSANASSVNFDGSNTFYSFNYTNPSLAPTFRTNQSYVIDDCSVVSCSGDTAADFNCDCESIPLPADGYTTDTLANLRQRVLIRSGYAAQAANPPPGMVLLVNEFLRDAQNQIFRTYFPKRITRFYSWQMTINQRYYGFATQDGVDCRTLDPNSVDWVGFEDCNQAWYELVCGIDPILYTRAQISTGWPTHYEIRSCIEIFPAPKSNYTLWVKGRFGLDPFTSDANTTTVDAEAVYLLATGMLKSHYGQADAGAVMAQASNFMKYLVAGQHDTRRYVPRTRVETPWTPPRFLPLNGQ